MTKTISTAIGGVFTVLIILFALTPALSAYADVREVPTRDRGTTGRTLEPTPDPVPPNDTPAPEPPAPTGGGISNSTDGVADSGGNSGGVVETGDEYVEVIVINIGPTNNTPPEDNDDEEDTEEPAPEPEPQCGIDGRLRVTCPSQTPTRTR